MELQLSISLSNESSALISFRINWFDLLVVQGTLKNLLQHRSSKASILQHSPFFMVQLSHSFITIGKTIALTRWTFVSKVERSRCRYIGGWVSQVELVVKNLPAKAGDIREVGLIPGSRRSPGGGHGNPLSYSCLENPMDRGAWQATVQSPNELDMTEAT